MWVRGRSKVTIVKNHGTEIFSNIVASDLLGNQEFAAYSHPFMPHESTWLGHLPASFVASFIDNNPPGLKQVACTPWVSVAARKVSATRSRRMTGEIKVVIR